MLSLSALLLMAVSSMHAQEVPEGWRFGGWEFIEVNHDFGQSPFFGSFYFEHDNLQYRHFDCWYTRTTAGMKLLSWLKADVAYDLLREPSVFTHKLLIDAIAGHTAGPLKVTLRERYVHSWKGNGGGQGDVLRSRLKLQYKIPSSRFSPYLAIELFTWKSWIKTRHYVACNYDLTRWMQLEAYYLYYTYHKLPAQHILGLGVNFYI